jgi:protein phosphatase 1L
VLSSATKLLNLLAQQLKERKRIQEAGGFISFNGVWRVAGILATSRALGDFPLKVEVS